MSRMPSRLGYHFMFTEWLTREPTRNCPSAPRWDADAAKLIPNTRDAMYSPMWPVAAGRPIKTAISLSTLFLFLINSARRVISSTSAHLVPQRYNLFGLYVQTHCAVGIQHELAARPRL